MCLSSGLVLLPFFLLPAIEDAIQSEHPIHALIRMPLVLSIYMIVALAWVANFETWIKKSSAHYSYLVNLVVFSFALSFETKDVAVFFWELSAAYAAARLAFSQKTRRELRSAFSLATNPPVIEARNKILFSALAAGIISSILIFLKFRDVFTICLALTSWLIVAWLSKLNLTVQGKKPTLKYYFAKSATEFLAVCASAVAACCIVAILIAHFSPGWLTVGNFTDAKQSLEKARDILKNLKLTSFEGIASVLFLCALRLAVLRRHKDQHSARLLDNASSRIKKANKFVGYAYLALVAIASFTLANTRPGAPIYALDTRIEDILTIQASAQSRMYWYLQAQYKRQLLEKDWGELPAETQSAVVVSNRKLSDDWLVFQHYERDLTTYGLNGKDMPVEFQSFREVAQLPAAGSFDFSTKSSLTANPTLNQLEAADREATDLCAEVSREQMPAYLQGMGEDLAHKVFDAVLPLEEVCSHCGSISMQTRFLEHIGTEYPLIHEMASSVAGAVQDYTFDKLWALAGDLISHKEQDSKFSLRASAEQSILASVAKVRPHSEQKQLPLGDISHDRRTADARIAEIDELAKEQLLERVDMIQKALSHLSSKAPHSETEGPIDTNKYRSQTASHSLLDTLSKIDKGEHDRLAKVWSLISIDERNRLTRQLGEIETGKMIGTQKLIEQYHEPSDPDNHPDAVGPLSK